MGRLRELWALVRLEHALDRAERPLLPLAALVVALAAAGLALRGGAPLLLRERWSLLVLSDQGSALDGLLERDGRFAVSRAPYGPVEGADLASFDGVLAIPPGLDALALGRDVAVPLRVSDRPAAVPLVAAVRALAARYSEAALQASLEAAGKGLAAAPPAALEVEVARELSRPGLPRTPLGSARQLVRPASPAGQGAAGAARPRAGPPSGAARGPPSEVALRRLRERLADGGGGAEAGPPWDASPLKRFALPLLLLLPAFLVSSALSQSVARERERRAGEALLSCPVAPSTVLLAKAAYHLAVSLGLAALLLAALAPRLPLGPLLLAASAAASVHVLALSLDLLLGVYFSRLGELMSALVAAHLALALFLVVPAAAPASSPLHGLSPLATLADALDGSPPEPARAALSLALPAAASAAALALAAVLFSGDALLGSPSLADAVAVGAWRLTLRHGRPALYAAAFLSQLVGAALSLLAELGVLLAVLVVPSPAAFVLAMGAMVALEEASKVYLAWSLRARPGLDVGGTRALFLACLASAVGFWAFELAAKGLFLLPAMAEAGALPDAGVAAAYLRLLLASSVAHIALTAVAAIGVVQGTRRALAASLGSSTLLHLAFDLWVLGGW